MPHEPVMFSRKNGICFRQHERKKKVFSTISYNGICFEEQKIIVKRTQLKRGNKIIVFSSPLDDQYRRRAAKFYRSPSK